jgi:hypothetical protein
MDELRRPLLIAALVAILLALFLCLGSSLITKPPAITDRIDGAFNNQQLNDKLAAQGVDLAQAKSAVTQSMTPDSPPGLAIPDLALINGILLLVLILTTLPLLVGDRVTGTIQGVISIIGGLVGLITGITMAIVAFTALILMVSLFLAVPFGTLAYLVIFGSFNTSGAAAITGMVILLQIAAGILLILAQERFLQSKGLVLLFATTIVLTFVVSLLHSIVPGILVSITDAIAALVVGVVGAIWSLVVLIGGVIAALRLLQLGRQGGPGQLKRTAG